MRTINTPASVNTTAPDGGRIVWGFMFENTLFTEFECKNHPIIEAAYRQRKKKNTSHYITITDTNLPKPGKAKVYFGVAQNHLRMPGTRYYVKRQVIRPIASELSLRPHIPAVISPTPPVSSPYPLPSLFPSPTSSFSSSSFSSMDASLLYPITHNLMHQSQQQTYKNTPPASFADDLPLIDLGNYTNIWNENLPLDFNIQYSSSNTNSNFDIYTSFCNVIGEMNGSNYSNYFIPTNLVTSFNCNCHISDVNNAIEDQSWFNELISLGLL